MLLPFFLLLSAMMLGPIGATFAISLTNWYLNHPVGFVGLDNYVSIARDNIFWQSLKVTLGYVVLTVPAQLLLGLGLALLVNRNFRGRGIFRSIFFFPYIVAMVIIGAIWTWIYNPNWGLLNFVLTSIGAPTANWLGDPYLALISVAIVGIWKDTGYFMVLFLAGLQAIPETFYSAAKIDGADSFNIFRKITFPMLRPTMVLNTILATLFSFEVFDSVFVMTGGGPEYGTHTIVEYIWEAGFGWFRIGYAAAIAVLLFLIILVIVILQRKYITGGFQS